MFSRSFGASYGSQLRVLAAAIVCGLVVTGCSKMLADGAFDAASKAGEGVKTIHAYETAKQITFSGLGQLESLHSVSPANPGGLMLLTQAWAGAASGFIWDDWEQAFEADDEVMMGYHQTRAQEAYKRAKFYGHKLLSQRAEGFEAAQKDASTLKVWLKENFTEKEHAPEVLWVAFAYINAIQADSENAELISELYVSVEMLKHVVRLDEELEHGLARVILGGVFSTTAFGEPEEGKKQFDRAIELTGGRFVAVHLAMAITYYCQTQNEEGYMSALNQVLESPDPLPEARIATVVAKRRARRYLNNSMWQDECGFSL